MKSLRGLNAQLVGHLSKQPEWAAKGTLTADMTWTHQSGKGYGKRYLPETVGRALRHLEEMGILAVRDDGVSVKYRWIPHEHRARYIPWSCRPEGARQILWIK